MHLNILAQPPPTISTFYRTISSTLCTYQTKVQPDGQSRATERQTSWSLAYSYGLKYRPVTLSNRLRAEWGGGPVHMPAMWQSIKAWVIASCDMRVLPAGTRQDCILKSSLEKQQGDKYHCSYQRRKANVGICGALIDRQRLCQVQARSLSRLKFRTLALLKQTPLQNAIYLGWQQWGLSHWSDI